MRLLLSALLLSLSLSALADEPVYNRVSFSEQASIELENDLMVAALFTQSEGQNAAGLADTVNRTITHAVKRARGTPGIEVSTQGYQTHPIYQKSRIVGWRVRQEIRLQSHDAKTLGALIGDLQASGLRVSSLGYQLSPEKRRKHLEQVTVTALKRFSQRAERIARALGRKGYRLVRLSVNDGGAAPPVAYRRAMVADAAMAESVGPVTLEAGTARLSVNVNGEIELRE